MTAAAGTVFSSAAAVAATVPAAWVGAQISQPDGAPAASKVILTEQFSTSIVACDT